VVRLSVPSVLTQDLFRALQPLLDEHPALRLQVEVNDRPVSPVAAGLDVVILGGRWNDSSLIARKLVEVQLVPLASQSYLEAHGTPTTPEQLADHRTLHFKTPAPQTTWTLTDATGGEHTVPVQSRVEVDDGRGLFDALVAGLGVALLSSRVARSAPSGPRTQSPACSASRAAVSALTSTTSSGSSRASSRKEFSRLSPPSLVM
jgi:DNA-binding transcriptional LysR family regulator